MRNSSHHDVKLQEYHIRQMDGNTLDAEAKHKVKKCLEAAIERRTSEVNRVPAYLHLTRSLCRLVIFL